MHAYSVCQLVILSSCPSLNNNDLATWKILTFRQSNNSMIEDLNTGGSIQFSSSACGNRIAQLTSASNTQIIPGSWVYNRANTDNHLSVVVKANKGWNLPSFMSNGFDIQTIERMYKMRSIVSKLTSNYPLLFTHTFHRICQPVDLQRIQWNSKNSCQIESISNLS